MEFTVVSRRRPILLGGRVRRYRQAISFPAVERLTILVLNRIEIELACAKIFDAHENITVGQPPIIDRIRIWGRKGCPHRVDEGEWRRICPATVLREIRRKPSIEFRL